MRKIPVWLGALALMVATFGASAQTQPAAPPPPPPPSSPAATQPCAGRRAPSTRRRVRPRRRGRRRHGRRRRGLLPRPRLRGRRRRENTNARCFGLDRQRRRRPDRLRRPGLHGPWRLSRRGSWQRNGGATSGGATQPERHNRQGGRMTSRPEPTSRPRDLCTGRKSATRTASARTRPGADGIDNDGDRRTGLRGLRLSRPDGDGGLLAPSLRLLRAVVATASATPRSPRAARCRTSPTPTSLRISSAGSGPSWRAEQLLPASTSGARALGRSDVCDVPGADHAALVSTQLRAAARSRRRWDHVGAAAPARPRSTSTTPSSGATGSPPRWAAPSTRSRRVMHMRVFARRAAGSSTATSAGASSAATTRTSPTPRARSQGQPHRALLAFDLPFLYVPIPTHPRAFMAGARRDQRALERYVAWNVFGVFRWNRLWVQRRHYGKAGARVRLWRRSRRAPGRPAGDPAPPLLGADIGGYLPGDASNPPAAFFQHRPAAPLRVAVPRRPTTATTAHVGVASLVCGATRFIEDSAAPPRATPSASRSSASKRSSA